VDWGQDLPALKSWLDHRHDTSATTRLYLAYFGTALRAGMESRRRHSHSILPLKDYRPSNRVPTALALPFFSKSIPFNLEMERRYESAYRLALAQPAHRGMVANNSVTNGGSLQRLQFARLCAYLRKREPIANIGNSILVFQLNQRELDQALYGPPAELAPSL